MRMRQVGTVRKIPNCGSAPGHPGKGVRMARVYDHGHVVREEEVDELGHVNNLAYLRWMQDAALAHSAEQGWPAGRYHELGAGWVVRSHQIEYLRPAFAGQAIVVRTWVSTFRRISSLRKYRILRPADDTLLALAETNWAFVCFQRRTPQRVPPELCAAFELVPPDQEP
jgi:acyl-CoA thioester hydrolase